MLRDPRHWAASPARKAGAQTRQEKVVVKTLLVRRPGPRYLRTGVPGGFPARRASLRAARGSAVAFHRVPVHAGAPDQGFGLRVGGRVGEPDGPSEL